MVKLESNQEEQNTCKSEDDHQAEEELKKQAKIKKEQMMAFVKALHRSIKEVFLKWPLEDVEAYIHNMHRDRKLQQEHVFKLQQQQQQRQQLRRIQEDTNTDLRVENTEQLNTLGGSESESQEDQSESETSEENAGAEVKKGKKNLKTKQVINKNKLDNEIENNEDQKGKKQILSGNIIIKNLVKNLNNTYDKHILKPDSIMHKNINNTSEKKTNHNLNQLFSDIYDPQYIHIIDKQVSIHVVEW